MSEEMKRALGRNPDRVPGKLTETEKQASPDRLWKDKIKQEREVYQTKIYQYWAPFNVPNIRVEVGRPGTGAEYNCDGIELDVPPYGAITVAEDEPIVGVEVIGSACVQPGYVVLHGEPLEWKYPRTGVKMKVRNLWGDHVEAVPWRGGVDEGFRMSGLSSAYFGIPECSKITILGGSETDIDLGPQWEEWKYHDGHYCVRMIRIIVKV